MYLKLIKLLWAADRLSLRNFGSNVTEDHYFALPYGPVPSETFNLMKACKPGARADSRWISEADAQWWKEHFETRNYALRSIDDPGSDYLSRADTLMLEEAYKKFRETGRFDASNNISHIYPEWARSFDPKVSGKSFDIDLVTFFDDPENRPDLYFQVAPETLKTARYFFDERKALAESIGIAL